MPITYERSDGNRHVTLFSRLHRRVIKVRGTRGLDLDLYQYCNLCYKPYLFCEVKPYEVSDGSWLMARKLTLPYAEHGCKALLVIEPNIPPSGKAIGFKFWSTVTGMSSVQWLTEEEAVEVLNQLAECHDCYWDDNASC